jgi:hypothetical protein
MTDYSRSQKKLTTKVEMVSYVLVLYHTRTLISVKTPT